MGEDRGAAPGGRRVVVLDTGYASYEEERAIFAGAGYDFSCFEGDREDRAGRVALAQDADGILVRWTRVDAPLLDALPGVRAVVRYGVGYDNVDLDAAARRGVRVANVRGYASHAVSDHALALLLACSRALPLGARALHARFSRPPRRPLYELHDRTLGIVGLGQIGSTLARKARGLFGRIVAADPYRDDPWFAEAGVERMPLDELLAASDVVSLHCNLTEETTHLIDRTALGRMRPGAILINTARGPVVDEAALLDALDDGTIYAAGLDVFEQEPPPPERALLVDHPHVVATGHYAWYSEAAQATLQRRAAENMVVLLRGGRTADDLV